MGADLFIQLSGEVRSTACDLRGVEIAEYVSNNTLKIKDTAVEYCDTEAVPLNIGLTSTLAPYLTNYFSGLFNDLFPTMRVTIIEDLPQNMLQAEPHRVFRWLICLSYATISDLSSAA